MDTIRLYTTDYGHRINVRTYLSDLADASSVALKFKNLSTGTKKTLSATANVSATDDEGDYSYEIYATISSSDWLSDMAGKWIGVAEATFSNGVVTSLEPFQLIVKATPTS